MKKIIFLLTLVLMAEAIAVISGYKQAALNEMAEKHITPVAPKDIKSINKPDVIEFSRNLESSTQKNAPENKLRILLILKDDTRLTGRSPSLWWSYQNTSTGKPGC